MTNDARLDVDELRQLHTWVMQHTSISWRPIDATRGEWGRQLDALIEAIPALLMRLEAAEQERNALHTALVAAWNTGEHAGWCPHDTEMVCLCWHSEVRAVLDNGALRAALSPATQENPNDR